MGDNIGKRITMVFNFSFYYIHNDCRHTRSVVLWEGFGGLGGVEAVVVIDEGLCGILVVGRGVDSLFLVSV